MKIYDVNGKNIVADCARSAAEEYAGCVVTFLYETRGIRVYSGANGKESIMVKKMKTCNSCYHWETQDQTIGVCMLITESNMRVAGTNKAVIDVEVRADDDQGLDWSASVITGPKFGCLEHKER